MSQTAYSVLAAEAVAGMPADNTPLDIRSFANEESTGLEAGRPCVRGTAVDQVLLPSAGGDEFLGVSVFQQAIEDETLGSALLFSDGETVGVMTRGRLWVTVEIGVTAGDDVYWRHTVNGGLIPGGWRNDADTANAVQVVQAKFETTALADGLALMSINLP